MTDLQSEIQAAIQAETIRPQDAPIVEAYLDAFRNPEIGPLARLAGKLAALNEPQIADAAPKTSPIGIAIRDEIRKLLATEVLDLERLEAIYRVAKEGRALLAIRNPLTRFDARAQGLESAPMWMGMMGTSGAVINCNPHGGWNGPAILGAREAFEHQIQTRLADSPLAKAVKLEVLDLVSSDMFGPTELLQIEQMAARAHRVLASALGLGQEEKSRARQKREYMSSFAGTNPYIAPYDDDSEDGMPMAPSTSEETYGAKISRELNASLGKLTDMLGRIDQKLGEPKKDEA